MTAQERMEKALADVARMAGESLERLIAQIPVGEDRTEWFKGRGGTIGGVGIDPAIRYVSEFVDGLTDAELFKLVVHEVKHRMARWGWTPDEKFERATEVNDVGR